jgi:predicted aspartyl protease
MTQANPRAAHEISLRSAWLMMIAFALCMHSVAAQTASPTPTPAAPAVGTPPFASSAAATCHPVASAVLPMRLYHGHFLVEIDINGRSLPMMIDSGAQHSTITPTMAQALGLETNERHRVRVRGVGGVSQPTLAVTASRLTFGNSQRLGYDLTVAEIARAGEDGDPQAPAGLLAADLLSSYDVELDFPRQTMTLYLTSSVSRCAGDFVPWSAVHDRIDAVHSAENALLIPVALESHPVLALVDTGAQRSLVSHDAALAAGVDPAVLAQEPMGALTGMNGMSVAAHRHRFESMRVGRATFTRAPVLVQDPSDKPAEMLLGLDFLRWRKVWLSYATGQVFLQFTPRPRVQPMLPGATPAEPVAAAAAAQDSGSLPAQR